MKKTYKHLVASFVLCTLFLGQARAQNMNFTQYPLAPAQSNPALIATSNQTNISFNHRYQFIGSGVSYQSSMVSATMPWLQGGTDRKGAFGITAFQDRTGENGIFTTTGLLGSVAYNHFLGNSTTGSRYLSIKLVANGMVVLLTLTCPSMKMWKLIKKH
jgi:type IX secretion system PorP/SprF family membrane protein